MPEYQSPEVYNEEFDIGPKPIEGVSTSTARLVPPPAVMWSVSMPGVIPTLVCGKHLPMKRILGLKR